MTHWPGAASHDFFTFYTLAFSPRPVVNARQVDYSADSRGVGTMNGNDGNGNDGTRSGVRAMGRVEGTNVVRVPFGVRQPRRARPARPERWATVVLPFQIPGGHPTPPPQAA